MDLNKTAFGILCVLYLVSQAAAQVSCTSAGRFADPNDTTCQNYTLCVANSDNTFLSYNYVCPSTSLFNPSTGLCTTNYVCNVTATPTTTANQTCTSDSFVPDPNVTDCSSYVVCVSNGNGTFDQTVQACPSGFYFDPSTTLCEQNYTCSTTTTFSCTAVGRYADPADTTCQNYYFCVQATNGTLIQYSYTCPNTSVFSPTTGVCTTSYVCPD